MLVKMAEVLVKIAVVMMVATAAFRRPPKRGGGGAPAHPGWARPHPRGPLVRRLMLYFGRKKANFCKKIWAKVSIQSELRISIYIRNGERAEHQNAETER